MKWILKVKDDVNSFYEKYYTYLKTLAKFVGSLCVFLTVMYNTGYNETFSSPFIGVLLALICAFLPHAAIIAFMAILVVIQFASVSIEVAAIAIVVFLLLLLLYFVFKSGDSWLLPLVCVACLWKVPAAILPIALMLSPIQIIVVAFGVLIYNLIVVVQNDVTIFTSQITTMNMVGKINRLLSDLFSNSSFVALLLCLCASMLLISIIRRSKIRYASVVASVFGGFLFLAGNLLSSYLFGFDIPVGLFIISYVINAIMTIMIINFAFNMDYKRVEQIRFEDDEYFYYVKAIPKVSITATNKQIETITTEEREEESEAPDDYREFSGFEMDESFERQDFEGAKPLEQEKLNLDAGFQETSSETYESFVEDHFEPADEIEMETLFTFEEDEEK